MANIFVSYRREDTAGDVNGLVYRLKNRFGEDSIFRDIHSIEGGEKFRDVIDRAVGSCHVLIAVIGKKWLATVDSAGQRRIDNPQDFVQLEIAAALRRNIRVVPVLVQDSAMPEASDLPDALKELADRQAVEIRDVSWEYDVDRLIETLERVLSEDGSGAGGGKRLKFALKIALAALALVLLSLAIVRFAYRSSTAPVSAKDNSKNLNLRTDDSNRNENVGRPDRPPPSNENQPDPELVYWERIRRSDNAEDFKKYLAEFPDGHFVQQARARIRQLEKPVVSSTDLRNTKWQGETTSGRKAAYRFLFEADNTIRFNYSYKDEPEEGTITGTWRQENNEVAIFVGDGKTHPQLNMRGAIAGRIINGSTINMNNQMTWRWTVRRIN